MFKTLSDRRTASHLETRRAVNSQLLLTEQPVEQSLDGIAEPDVPSIVAAYERRIRHLEQRKIVLTERIANCGGALPDFDGALNTSLDYLRSPVNLWQSAHLVTRERC